MDPFIISSLILAISFFFILLCNLKLKSKIISISFLVLSLVYLILIVLFDNNYIYQVLKALITYLWYPNYLILVTVVLLSIFNFIYTVIKKKQNKIIKIVVYLEFCLTFVCYLTFLRLGINENSYVSLYSTNSLILMRIVTISFIVSIIGITIIKRVNRGSK